MLGNLKGWWLDIRTVGARKDEDKTSIVMEL